MRCTVTQDKMYSSKLLRTLDLGKHLIIFVYGDRQKKFSEKNFGNKVLNFATKKVLWKKVLEIESYNFETLFSMNFVLVPV